MHEELLKALFVDGKTVVGKNGTEFRFIYKESFSRYTLEWNRKTYCGFDYWEATTGVVFDSDSHIVT